MAAEPPIVGPRSTTSTRAPSSVAAVAADIPAIPAPRTTTSVATSAAKVPPFVAREQRLHNLGHARLDVNSLHVLDELAGRVAVVTGAASGIGLALCERFAAE